MTASSPRVIAKLFLSGSYVLQIIYPFVFGQSVVSVNLLDPTLLVLESAALLLTIAWIFVGATNYQFATRLGKMEGGEGGGKGTREEARAYVSVTLGT